MTKFLTVPFLLFFLSSCNFQGDTGLTSQIAVRVVAQHSDSFIRTASGRPYIRLQGGRRICRVRPFNIDNIRESLIISGVSSDILNSNFFRESSGEETAEGVEGSSSSNEERPSTDPVYYDVAENWIEFGLQIANPTEFILVINKIRLNGVGRCGGKVYTYSGEEKGTEYCSENGFPALYIVPPGTEVNYHPESLKAFDNLKLYFSGFEIEDRRGDFSRRLQNQTEESKTQGEVSNPTANTASCQPQREDYAIPTYQMELNLLGYFLGVTDEYVTLDFFKRVSFSTDVVY